MRLSYIMLGVSDLERSAAFYSRVLGLEPAARFEEFISFDTGDVTLMLSGQARWQGKKNEGACELVFGVESVTATFNALNGTVPFMNEPRQVYQENWAVNFQDPDGHLLSFYGAR